MILAIPSSGWGLGRHLSNQGELLRLLDFEGNEVDAVAYADEGEWAKRMLGPEDHGYRGWVWSNQHDGRAHPLERQSLEVAGAYGQNWLPSFAAGGTPGSRNGRSKSVIAPIIRKLEHWPQCRVPMKKYGCQQMLFQGAA